MIPKKVMLAGNFGVGKTSLFNQFLHNTFDEAYRTTIGVKVDSKLIETSNGPLKLMLWDIAGEVTQEKVPRTYWLGSKAVVYVFDLTRPVTWSSVEHDLSFIRKVLPEGVIRLVANKTDLVDKARIQEAFGQLAVDTATSAKTGENVPSLFTQLAENIYRL
ncbi:MAG: Rab family GTPase [Bacteroidota bacterium]